LSNVLIPLTVHPIFECKTKSEEGLALESIATLGALSRMLSWSKYNNLLWTLISQFDRHPEQERYLVGAMCAMMDSFHFQLLMDEVEEDDSNAGRKSSVWRSLENRIIPKLEGLLSKEILDRNGNRSKLLRPNIVLAMTKLFQKFPVDYFESKLPGVITVICDVLRSRDSDSRDMARTTLAKIVCSIDLKYLADVVRELAVTLTEGYKLHVRAAAVHTILLELSKVYETPSKGGIFSSPPGYFDRCVPALMDLIQEDLFGEANERKMSQETSVRYVKEASGNKSVHSVELISKMIIFSPTNSSGGNQSRSSVHCVLSPFLERLKLSDVDAAMIRKIREILSRVVVGISNNESLTGEALLPFLYATIHPFIGDDAINSVIIVSDQRREGSDVTEDDDSVESIKVSGRDVAKSKQKQPSKPGGTSVVEWRPSSLQTSSSEKTATGIKYDRRRKLRKVQDGSSAPKLTGSSRHEHIGSHYSKRTNDPATICGIVFCLNLLNTCLKKTDMAKDIKLRPMMDPFVPMLTACVTHCRSTEISLVALKCLHHFLRVDLPSTPQCFKHLGSQTLHLLAATGSSSNHNHDLTQACFKTLTYIVNNDNALDQDRDETGAPHIADGDGEHVFANQSALPLNSEQMKVLVSLLRASVTETDQHNPALNLIKAILSHRFVSPEFYDLMESLLKLVVRSQKATLRQVSPTNLW
jgi:U3 small nucleolar RNA-associated protein 20